MQHINPTSNQFGQEVNRRGQAVLIIGCGDIGCRVAQLEMQSGRKVMALARSDNTAQKLRDQGIAVIRGDLDAPASLTNWPSLVSTLFYFAPPPLVGTDDPRIAALLSALRHSALPRRLVYLSTSGVYGDCQGAWVNEDWPVNPISDRARRRLAAEDTVQEWCDRWAVPRVILRVPGIYGPGRLPVERIRAGIPVLNLEDSPYSNRIHADDLAQACFVAARRGISGRVYNISDGHPTSMTDYFFRVADALGLPRPPTLSMEAARKILSPGMLSFLAESKRLDNRRMIEELQITLRYPDLTHGLAQCLTAAAVD